MLVSGAKKLNALWEFCVVGPSWALVASHYYKTAWGRLPEKISKICYVFGSSLSQIWKGHYCKTKIFWKGIYWPISTFLCAEDWRQALCMLSTRSATALQPLHTCPLYEDFLKRPQSAWENDSDFIKVCCSNRDRGIFFSDLICQSQLFWERKN